ncbi:AAA family ATPase [Nonomuraea sp. H19]|uniref:ATP-binding protein n=1 Tax=Nonomuraea sp. H19 TaxID=3452206 RepID=UPI003F8A554F
MRATDPVWSRRAPGPCHFARPPAYFTGREEELAEHAAWMDDERPAAALRVVTGQPGVGKSALLGMLVCASHHDLAPLDPMIRGARRLPRRGLPLAGVHARGQTLRQVTGSIAKQLRLARADAHGWTAAALIAAIRDAFATGPPPIVVLDALDEAAAPDDLMRLLLLELARLERGGPSAGPACRVLVGTRAWEEFTPLLDAAASAGQICDLDAVPARQVRQDITQYVELRLRACASYRHEEAAGVRHAISEAIAKALTDPQRNAATSGGAFLVAGLFAHYLTSRDRAAPAVEPARIRSMIPATLGEILELDLAQSWRRPVLAALASAKEPGLPARLLGSVATELRPRPPEATGGWEPPGAWHVESILDAVGFYLRRSVGQDGVGRRAVMAAVHLRGGAVGALHRLG